jgi:hypothetical protein
VQTATGQIRYGPQSHTVKRRSGWWLLLVCDRDWFRRYAPLVQSEMPAKWVTATDPQRRAGTHAEPESRLAVLRPTLLEPAWRPHICAVRRERPKRHRELWELAIKVGDAVDEETHLIESAKYLRHKAELLDIARCCTGSPKERLRVKGDKQDALRAAQDRDARLPAVRREIRRLRRRWLTLAVESKVSLRFEPGVEVEFEYDPNPKTNGKHWWFDVV